MEMDRAFVVRCWHEGMLSPEDLSGWRFSLTEIGGGQEPRGFVGYEELAAFLKMQLCQLPAPLRADAPPSTGGERAKDSPSAD